LELLRGLLDTDGWISRKDKTNSSCRVGFCSVSRDLVEDVLFLVQSLGGVATTRKATNRKYTHKNEVRQGQSLHVLTISMPEGMNPFQLSRKANQYVERSTYKPRRAMIGVDSIGMKPVRCIRVAADDGLYLTDHCIVTHNTVFALDEFGSEEFVSGGKDARVMSSVSSISNCIFLVSTFGSETGVFAEEATDPDNPLLVKLDWKENPTQTKNAYVIRNCILEAVNPADQPAVDEYGKTHALELGKIARRGHKMEGKFRSPWYDQFCLMPGHTPRFVAREMDMDPRGAAGKLFLTEVLDEMRRKHAKPPTWEGRPAVINGELRLLEQAGAPLKLWFKPGLNNEPPKGTFVIGSDIATGVAGEGGSNSCLIGGNALTCEQVLEYTDPNISPIRLARLAEAICRWLHEAMLIWEVMGPTGKGFGTEIMQELGYWNVWTRLKENKITKERTKIPGWVNNSPGAKLDLFDLFGVAMAEGEFIPRSEDMLKECGGWEFDGAQIIYKGTGHGDRAIAGGLCCKAMKEIRRIPIDKSRETNEAIPEWSMAGRLQRRQEAEKREDEDDFAGFSYKTVGGW
jgi:hypothetical protein